MNNVPLTKTDLDLALSRHSVEETDKIQAMITAATSEKKVSQGRFWITFLSPDSSLIVYCKALTNQVSFVL